MFPSSHSSEAEEIEGIKIVELPHLVPSVSFFSCFPTSTNIARSSHDLAAALQAPLPIDSPGLIRPFRENARPRLVSIRGGMRRNRAQQCPGVTVVFRFKIDSNG
jgi:hypothetical protein